MSDARSSFIAVLALAGCATFAPQATRAAEPSAGGRAYLTCGACHGRDGGGVADGSVPAIGGQPTEVIRAALLSFRVGERADLRMNHFADEAHLADEQAVAAVAVHVAALRRELPATTGDGSDLVRGEARYRKNCAGCHGTAGAAMSRPPVPALAGQHAPYLVRKLAEPERMGSPDAARRHAALMRRLGAAGAASIADWLSRLPPP